MAQWTLTSLSLYGYRVDGAIANRVFPTAEADDWRTGWAQSQAEQLEQARRDMAPLTVLTAGYGAQEPVGLSALAEVAANVYPDGDPLALPTAGPPLSLERLGESQIVVVLRLPLALKGDVDVAERADELIVTSGAYRRVIALPSLLQRYQVVGAGLVKGVLRVRFQPEAG